MLYSIVVDMFVVGMFLVVVFVVHSLHCCTSCRLGYPIG